MSRRQPYTARPGVRPAAPCACCGTRYGVVQTRGGHYRRSRGLCDRCYDAESAAGRLHLHPYKARPADAWLDEYRRLAPQLHLDRAEVAHRVGLSLSAMDRALTRARRRGDPRAVRFADVRA